MRRDFAGKLSERSVRIFLERDGIAIAL